MNAESLLALERLELIIDVDATRGAADPFKLSAALLNLAGTRRLNLLSRIAAANLTEGDRAGASVICRGCRDRLERWHRAGCRYLDGLLPDTLPDSGAGTGPYISDAIRLQLKTAYGFVGGVAGAFTDDRTEHLAQLAPQAAGIAVANPAWHYPQDLLNAIAADYSTLQA